MNLKHIYMKRLMMLLALAMPLCFVSCDADPAQPDVDTEQEDSQNPGDSQNPSDSEGPSDSDGSEETLTPEEQLARLQNVPHIYIDTKNVPINSKENYVEGTITVRDSEKLYSDVEEFTAPMGIRGRGNSTWTFPKKPWKVKLKEKASILGMPADKEWCLLANYSDRTLVRNITVMKLSEICGFSWTPKMCSVEVTLNGEYQGVYTFSEHKKVSKNRVNIDLVGASDNEGEAVTGGYYLEIEEAQDEDVCWTTRMEIPMMFSDPSNPTEQQQEYVKGLFYDFEQTLYDEDYSEETGYRNYIDVKSFIDNLIVQEFTKNPDGNLRKSTFLTKEIGKKLEMYHIWDFDLTLGNAGFHGSPVGGGPENLCIMPQRWYKYLSNDRLFVDDLKTRWNELYPRFKEVPDFIREQTLYLEKAAARNFSVWSIYETVSWVGVQPRGSYEGEVEYLLDFYTRRLEWLNTAINNM